MGEEKIESERERENRRKRDREAERVNWVSVVELENFASVMRERRRLPSRSRLNCVYESAVGKTETLGELETKLCVVICINMYIGMHSYILPLAVCERTKERM